MPELQLTEEGSPDPSNLIDCPGCPKCNPHNGYILKNGSGRPTRAHEYVFLLAKSARYFYDADAIREDSAPLTAAAGGWQGRALRGKKFGAKSVHENYADIQDHAYIPNPAGRNRRTVWSIATQPYSGAHYATMPEALIEPCILAGSSAQACEHCGAAWVRVVERGEPIQQHWAPGTQEKIHEAQGKHGATSVLNTGYTRPNTTTGFAPSCACPGNTGAAASIVLDPFAGSGTTLRVAARYQRNAIGIELNQEYIEEHVEKRTNGLQVEMFV